MSTVENAELKYLWTATFEDGTEIVEPADDRYSKLAEGEDGPSAFRDVLDKQEQSKLVTFHLTNVETGDKIGVDLETGQFAINGVAFDAHEQNLDAAHKELQIVFHREVREDTVARQTDLSTVSKTHYINRYFIGWQVKGENITQTVAVS